MSCQAGEPWQGGTFAVERTLLGGPPSLIRHSGDRQVLSSAAGFSRVRHVLHHLVIWHDLSGSPFRHYHYTPQHSPAPLNLAGVGEALEVER